MPPRPKQLPQTNIEHNKGVQLELEELQKSKTPDYQIMLLQGILMCLWYDLGQTVTVLEQAGAMETFFQFIF